MYKVSNSSEFLKEDLKNISNKGSLFENLHSLMSSDMLLVDKLILERIESKAELISNLAKYIMATGGKRLRPLLALASARLCGYTGKEHCSIAAGIEFLHTATLLHDDVVDGGVLRRGKLCANVVFGNKASVLVGDFLFSRAFDLLIQGSSVRVLGILAETASIIAEGEILQLEASNSIDITEEKYLKIIQSKTAELFSATCQIGAIVSEATKEQEEALREYGLNLGIAFQIADDTLDYEAEQGTFGKEIGHDFMEGKITLPIILAVRQSSDLEIQSWQELFSKEERSEKDLAKALGLLRKYGAADACLEYAQRYGDKAKHALSIFKASPLKEALIKIADDTIYRNL